MRGEKNTEGTMCCQRNDARGFFVDFPPPMG